MAAGVAPGVPGQDRVPILMVWSGKGKFDLGGSCQAVIRAA